MQRLLIDLWSLERVRIGNVFSTGLKISADCLRDGAVLNVFVAVWTRSVSLSTGLLRA